MLRADTLTLEGWLTDLSLSEALALKKYYVYRLLDLRTKPPTTVYVGRGSGKRVLVHIRGRSCNARVKNLQRKLVAMGMSLAYEILGVFDTHREACDAERGWIMLYRRKEDGGTLYNFTDGGEGMSNPSAETRAKLRGNKNALGAKRAPETRAKLRAARIGKEHTLESRAKMSATRLGKKRSPEAVAKSRAAHLGMKRPPETKAKIGMAKLGNKNWLGRQHMPETKEKLRAARLGQKHSLEAKAKMSAAVRAANVRRRAREASEKSSLTIYSPNAISAFAH